MDNNIKCPHCGQDVVPKYVGKQKKCPNCGNIINDSDSNTEKKRGGFVKTDSIGGNSAGMKTNPSQESPKYPAKNASDKEQNVPDGNVMETTPTSSSPESATPQSTEKTAAESTAQTPQEQSKKEGSYTEAQGNASEQEVQKPVKQAYTPKNPYDTTAQSSPKVKEENTSERASVPNKEAEEKAENEVIENKEGAKDEHNYVEGSSLLDMTKKFFKRLTGDAKSDSLEEVGGNINFNEDGFYDDTTNPYQNKEYKRNIGDYKGKIAIAIIAVIYVIWFIYHFAE